MCLICVEYNLKKLTINEAYRNLQEMKEILPEEHVEEIEKMLEHDTLREIYELEGDDNNEL